MKQTKTKTAPLHLGFIQLAVAFFLTIIVSSFSFLLASDIFDKPKIAMMATLIVLAVGIILCGLLAWKDKTSATWQYTLSQLAFAGAVFAGVACPFVSWGFLAAVIIYGGLALVMAYFNLSSATRRKAHEAYVPIHAITGAVVFVLAYAHYR